MMNIDFLAFQRKSFTKCSYMHNIPNLLQIQKESFHKFLQHKTPVTNRQQLGLQRIFCRAFPVNSNNGLINVDFIRYSASEPVLSVAECRSRSLTYSSSLNILVKVSFRNCNGTQWEKESKGWNVYPLAIGDIPLMTQSSTFLINGVDRVVVSQLHRTPGIYIERKKQGLFQEQDPNVAVKVIPLYGVWVQLELTRSNILYLSFDKSKKLPATTLLKSFGVLQSKIIPGFVERLVKLDRLGVVIGLPLIELKGEPIPFSIYENSKIIIKNHTMICNNQLKRLVSRNIKETLINDSVFSSLEYILILKPKRPRKINGLLLNKIRKFGIVNLIIRCPFRSKAYFKYLKETLKADKSIDIYDAQVHIYRSMKPGEPIYPDLVKEAFNKILTDERTYNISNIGRLAFNLRAFSFPQTKASSSGLLSVKDLIQAFKYLMLVKNNSIEGDDVDHLGNRRIRCVGEILESLFRNSFLAVEQAIKNIIDNCKNNSNLSFANINYRPICKAFNEFFVSSHLSQLLDQTNPLSELTHKRRLTSIGISGITKEHAGFEVRDVHPTYYGKVCPVETPEGQNIGLISSLAVHAKVNEHGLLQTPYRKVTPERINKSVQFLTASEEEGFTITSLDQRNHSKVLARRAQGITLAKLADVQYIDASSQQTVSVATSLIPFLEHDDANRALMGSNMQRQAVPCIIPRSPLIGTGTEMSVAIDTKACVVAKEAGMIVFADSSRLIIRSLPTITTECSHIEIHTLVKAERTNQNTYISFRPTVYYGFNVSKGEVIADGVSTHKGELALGKNVLVAFMVWKGYNFEDSVIVSEYLVGKDIFTSVHLEEFALTVSATKLGKEATTNTVPGNSDTLLNKLDNEGIIRAGSQVDAGDILVGKVVPKETVTLTAEEKLMNAIFSERSSEVRDVSLRVPPSVQGTVIYTQVFKATTAVNHNSKQHSMFNGKLRDKIHAIEQDSFSYVGRLLIRCSCSIKVGILQSIDPYIWLTMEPNSSLCHITFKEKRSIMEHARTELYLVLRRKVEKATGVYDLSPGILKVVKVLIATKRTLQPGDKMAGRHGNKGVVSKVVPVRDMPYTKDGRTVDIILNPLGVPSRMNVGQVFETHLGLAAKSTGTRIKLILNKSSIKILSALRDVLYHIFNSAKERKNISRLVGSGILRLAKLLINGVSFASPIFNGTNEEDIQRTSEAAFPLKTAYMLDTTQTKNQLFLTDGVTGKRFKYPATVGTMYYFKLHHLVEDKMHARSTGTYSIITQQPLGGKAQFGGQRFGEMEVWALEAYGAAYTLHEMLTIKSDDIWGRLKMYENIIKDNFILRTSVPESFNVLLREVRSLGVLLEVGG
ncbi:DNA-directed RNA polymerase subunit beta [Candidatus Tremblaya phenacola]|uniref:DNA-directed RNA polymerase subunit beta n=1 Tax=Candidatus Tremblayella phenacoccinincola TaxID=1010676 RepID=A0A2G0V6Y8_9PROT|nr:DNA-directed RNA polymerase subunit beta [Candidatus Tremblaya phenacola]PHN16222.1 DNA-directed RNA polymerase subunit beta [Candidatus Tremblaya phenacola]